MEKIMNRMQQLVADVIAANTRRVLLIDDDPGVLGVFRTIVQEYQCVMDEATDGQEGLRMISTKKYDLVLCDLKMPGMDGLEVFRQVVADHQKDYPPFVFLTGYVSPESVNEALDIGVTAWIPKPPPSPNHIRAVLRMFGLQKKPKTE